MTSPRSESRRDLDGDVPSAAPHRVMVLSADMGGGHNATASALEEAATRVWPGSEIRRVDVLDVMGAGVGPLFRGIYVANVERTPWLYEFFYASLWRRRWFAHASKRFTGSWCGRRLVPHIDRFDPDVILSTYPLATSGLEWLRLHRGLSVPTGAWVSDFAPHPFWVYEAVDATYVMDDAAVPTARAAEPEARVEVSPLPVVSRFRPGDVQAVRHDLGLEQDRLVVLLSTGAYAFGDVVATVRALVSTGDVQVVAVCGHNADVRRALERTGLPRTCLVVHGWVDDMTPWVQAADVVLTNAGGATALEAFSCGTPVLTVSPIAAHGQANADLMTVAGVTDLAHDAARLVALVRAAARDRRLLEPLRRRADQHDRSTGLDERLRDLASPRSAEAAARVARDTRGRRWPLRPADAFFGHVESDTIAQELGAVVDLGPTPHGRLTAADLARVVQPRTAGLPPTRRELVRDGATLGWRLHEDVDARDHIIERIVTPGSATTAWDEVAAAWSSRLPAGRPSWQMVLVRTLPHGPDLLAVKMHHCQGDGISALGLFDRLVDAEPGDPLRERRPVPEGVAGRIGIGGRRVLHGLAALAGRGSAPRHPLNRTVSSRGRDLVGVPLPWTELQHIAQRLGMRPHEVVVTLVADALDRLLRPAGLLQGAGVPIRAMVPVATRPPRLDRVAGNWTGTLSCDLPTGEMSFEERAERVVTELREQTRRGQAQAASLVMALAGRLPSRLHRAASQAVYGSRFFTTIVSYMPAARGPRTIAGAPIRSVFPVLPLARGVPLAIGVVRSDSVAGVGVMVDRALGLSRDDIADAVRNAFTAAGGRLPWPSDHLATGS